MKVYELMDALAEHDDSAEVLLDCGGDGEPLPIAKVVEKEVDLTDDQESAPNTVVAVILKPGPRK